MFNVKRPSTPPSCLSSGNNYNKEEVLTTLRKTFYEKCYLCEIKDIQCAEIEHFVPTSRGGGRTEWNNLYYSCRRCNGIKGDGYSELLDCTDEKTDVFNEIEFFLPANTGDDIVIKPTSANPSQKTENTINLLLDCYNKENTGNRRISRYCLRSNIEGFLLAFLSAKRILQSHSSGCSKKAEALEIITEMLNAKHPFSAIWRWSYLKDSFLVEHYPELKDEIS